MSDQVSSMSYNQFNCYNCSSIYLLINVYKPQLSGLNDIDIDIDIDIGHDTFCSGECYWSDFFRNRECFQENIEDEIDE